MKRQTRNSLLSTILWTIGISGLIIFSVTQHYKEYRKALKEFEHTRTVAVVIAAEACGEGEEGMIAVANTIANRAFKWHTTPYDIVTRRHQYRGYTALQKEMRYKECGPVAMYLSEHLFELDDITDGAIYFKRPEEKKKSWHKTLTVVIGNHEFYK